MKYKIITIETYHPEKMAQIKIGKKVIYMGNYWDFHPGCHGTLVGGYELGDNWKGPFGLAAKLKEVMDNSGKPAQIKHVHKKTRIKC